MKPEAAAIRHAKSIQELAAGGEKSRRKRHHSLREMCGRLNTHGIRWEDLDLEPPPAAIVRPSYNLAPGSEFLIIIDHTSLGRNLRVAEWGLQSRRNDGALKRLHNARCENVRKFHAFREAFLESRCVVPAHGFYEWRPDDRQPFYFSREDGHPLTLAGIFQTNTQGKMFAAILTMPANQVVGQVHHRMPVILGLDKLNLWLKKTPLSSSETSTLFDPDLVPTLKSWPVTKFVGNTRNDHPGLILPLEPQGKSVAQPTTQTTLFPDLLT